MAVYTTLSDADIQALATAYGLGKLACAKGIAEGVENTNYLLETETPEGLLTRTILTLYEKRVKPEDLPFYLELMHHLAEKNLRCPLPLTRTAGGYIADIHGKKATMVSFLEGKSLSDPSLDELTQAGAWLARMHLATADFTMRRSNDLALPGWRQLAEKIHGHTATIHPELDHLIDGELAHLARHWPDALPIGTLHADFFPDNVFFLNGRLSGVIDFYFACTDLLVYDLAIALCAWCFDSFTRINEEKAAAMIDGYHAVRPLSEEERGSLPTLLRGAALRFLLTRAHDLVFHPKGALVSPKDPMEYIHKLQTFQRGVNLL